MLELAIITAPRKAQYLAQSVNSLRRAGYNKNIKIFAEPGTYPEIPNTTFIVAKDKLGCFKNYTRALRLLTENSTEPFIGVLSDDFIYNKKTFETLQEALIDGPDIFGYYALYSPRPLHQLGLIEKGWTALNMGWGTTWGGLYVYDKRIAEKIINHEFYIDHYDNYEANQQIDHCIPEVCYRIGLDQFYHRPSLADHIGRHSTIGHKYFPGMKGINFKL